MSTFVPIGRVASSVSTQSAALPHLPRSHQSSMRLLPDQDPIAHPCCYWWDYRRTRSSIMSYPDLCNRGSPFSSICLTNERKHSWSWVDSRLPVSPITPYEEHILELCAKGDIASVVGDLSSSTFDVRHTSLSDSTYIALVQACRRTKRTAYALQVYSHIKRSRSQLGGTLGDSLVITLAKCGALQEARDLLDAFPRLSVCVWTAVISGYVDHDKHQDALYAFSRMQVERLPPNHYTFAILYKACGSLGDIEEGKTLHIDAEKKGYTFVLFVSTALISMYNKCRCLLEAKFVFTSLNRQDVFSWNAIMSTYLERGHAENTVLGYRQMLEEGGSPDLLTFTIAIRACGALGDRETAVLEGRRNSESFLEIGRSLHADIHKRGITFDALITNALVSMYGKCGSIRESIHVLESSSRNFVASWNSLIAAYLNEGEGAKALLLYKEMQKREISPDSHTLVAALRACLIWLEREEDISVMGKPAKAIALEIGEALHLDASSKGITSDMFFANTLIDMYGKCGNVMGAEYIFSLLPSPDLVSWNAMLSTYVQQFQAHNALCLFRQMLHEDQQQDMFTYATALQACSMLACKDDRTSNFGEDAKVMAHEIGLAIHARIRKRGFESNMFICNTLISMYGKCGNAVEVDNVFHSHREPDVVTWNAMLSAYIEQGKSSKALQLYKEMQENCQIANELTYVISLQACGALLNEDRPKVASLEIGRTLNAELCKVGFISDVVMVSALVTMYSKCGMILEAETIFNNEIIQHNLVTWNAMLSAYIEQGLMEKALDLYKKMEMDCVPLDEITFVCVLRASCQRGDIFLCKRVHFLVISAMLETSCILRNTLIHAYGCCGNMTHASAVFFSLCEPDLVSWNAWIDGYAHEADCLSSLSIFEQMQLTGVEPDSVTVLALLYACSHAGLIDGLKYLHFVTASCGLCPALKHYVAMLDLLGRTGNFTKMDNTLSLLPVPPTVSLWLCLLNACRMHGNMNLANSVFGNVVNLHSKNTSAHILLLSSIVDDAIVIDGTI